MPTLEHVTGFNDGHDFPGSSITINTTTVRSGGHSLFFGDNVNLGLPIGASSSGNVLVAVCYFNPSQLSNKLIGVLTVSSSADSRFAGIGYNPVTGQFCLFSETVGQVVSGFNDAGPVVQTGVWYRLEIRVNTSANPWVIDAKVAVADGPATTFTQGTVANASLVISNATSNVLIGTTDYDTTAPTVPLKGYFTDAALSIQSSDYPIGPISVLGYPVNGNGTHNLDASTSAFLFKEVSAVDTAITNVESTSYQTIADYPLDATADGVWVGTSTGAPATPSLRAWGTPTFSANNVTNTSLTPGAPAGVAVGDQLVMICASSSNAFTITVPTGWSVLTGFPVASGTSVGGKVYVLTRTADGSGADTPSVTFASLSTGTSGTPGVVVIGAYQNCQGVLDATIASSDLSTQTTTSVIPAQTTVTDKSLVVGIGLKMLESSGQTSTVATFTERVDSSTTSGTGFVLEVSDLVKTPAGSSGTATITWSATTSARALTVSLALKSALSVVQPTNTWYLEYNFTDEVTKTVAPLAVRVVAVQNLDTAVASTWVAKLYDSVQGTNVEDVYNASISSNTKLYITKTFAQRPNSGGAWTLSSLNGTRLRFGLTNAATGHPRLEGAMLEAAFAIAPYVEKEFITPLLITLGKKSKYFRLINPLLGTVPLISGTTYTDTDIVSSITSVQSSESTDFLDTSGAVNGVSTIPVTETVDFVESATVSTVSSVTYTETTDYVESATVATVTSLTSTDVYTPYIDPGFITPLLITLGERIHPFKLLNNSLLVESAQTTGINYIDPPSGQPTTSILDNFNRADGALGSPWKELNLGTTVADFQIVSNQLHATASSGSAHIAYYSSVTVTGDQEAYLTVNSIPTSSDKYLGLVVRMNDPGDNASAWNAYIARYDVSTGNVNLLRVASASANVVATVSRTLAVGDQLLLQTVNGTVTLYCKPSGGNWLTVVSYTDPSPLTNSGSPGVYGSGSAGTWLVDDFGGGTPLTFVAGVTTPSSNENSQYVEVATVSGVTSLASVELYVPNIDRAFVTPLLVTLGERILLFKLLNDNILGESPQPTSVDYFDSATISGVTSVQSSESTDFLDTSGSINGTSSLTYTENTQYIESATVSGITSLTATETSSYVDSSTGATVTSVTYTETTDFVESATTPSVTTVTSAETYVPFIQEPSIQPLLIGLVRAKGLKLLHNNILNPATPLTNVDYTDTATVSTVTSVQSSESTDFVDTSGAINGISSITFTEVAAYVDSATVSGVSTPSATDVAAYVDASTLSGVTSLTYTENAQYVESATVATVTSLSVVETTDFVESATVAGVTSLTSVDLYFTATHTPQPLLITLRRGGLRLLINSILNPADSVRVNYVESATVTNITSVSAVESTDYVESATVSTVGSVTSTDVAAFVDATTPNGTTTPSASDSTDLTESNTLSTTTSLTYTEVAAYSDTSTLASVTSITYTETTDFVDAATVAGVTTITYQETSQQVTSPPVPLLIQLSRHSGKLHILRDHTQLGASRQPIAYSESATVSGVTSVTYVENAQYVEAVTTSSATSCSSTDTTDYTDSNTPNSKTAITTTDVVVDVDAATISNTTTPSATDVASYVDSATNSSTTTPQSVDSIDRSDAASITSTTTVTFTESANYVDSLQPFSGTSLFSTDTSDYIDSGVSTTITYVSFVEQYTQSSAVNYLDSATITSRTTLTPEYEYGPIKAFFFVGYAARRWVMTSDYSRWEAATSRRWYSITTKFGKLQGVVSKRWRT